MIIVLNLTSLCHLAWLNSSYDICLFRIKNKMRCLCLPLLWLLKTIHNSWWFGYLNQENYFLPHWDAFQSFFFFLPEHSPNSFQSHSFVFSYSSPFYLYLFIYFYFWLRWVFAACRLSLVAASRGYSLLPCTGFSLPWLLLLQSTGSKGVGFNNCIMRAQ